MAHGHSPSSSLADVDVDVDYYTYSRSSSVSSLSNISVVPASATLPVSASASSGHANQKPSLANINVPSFAQFRSRVSSIPIVSPITAKGKAPAYSFTPSRAASLSKTQHGSPRIAQPISRPFSLDSPVQQQHSLQSGAGDTSSLNPQYAVKQRERWVCSHSY